MTPIRANIVGPPRDTSIRLAACHSAAEDFLRWQAGYVGVGAMTSRMDFPFYEAVSTIDKWLLVILYSYQIYADFFGYSAIAPE